MSFNQYLAEEKGLKTAVAPVDMNTAAITGARIKLEKGHRCAVAIHMGTSTAATVQVTLRQHNAATSGTSKNLVVDNSYYFKAGAATSFTKVEPSAAAALIDVSTAFAADGGILVVEVESAQLDTNGGFAWFSVDIADSGAAKLVSAVYVLGEVKNAPAYELAL